MREAIVTTLKKYGICTSKQLSYLIHRDLGETYKPTQIGGVLKAMYKTGEVGHSNCGAGATHYWLVEF